MWPVGDSFGVVLTFWPRGVFTPDTRLFRFTVRTRCFIYIPRLKDINKEDLGVGTVVGEASHELIRYELREEGKNMPVLLNLLGSSSL